MDVRYLLLLLLLVSCMPEGQVARSNLNDEGSTTAGSTTGGTTPPPETVTALSFNYLGTTSQSITLNASNLNTANIIGTKVQDYLSDSTNFTNVTYCMVSTFTIGGVNFDLRSRVLPVSYYDFVQKKTVRVYRIDFPDSTNSLSSCSGTLYAPDSSGDYVSEVSPTTVFAAGSLCPTCTSILSTTKVRLFKKETRLNQVPLSNLNLTSFVLRIDPNNSTTDNNNSCSNSSCQSRGFDCCLDNQCVNDGGVKAAGVSQYPSLFATAEAEKLENPLAYLRYPQLYYICSNSTGTTTGSTTGGTGYDEEFEKKKKDYACLQNLKSQATTSPYQSELLTKIYTAAADCLTGTGDVNEYYYYKNVVKRMYETCECNKATLELSINECPAFDYEAVSLNGTEPNELRCTIIEVDDGSTPLQTRLQVSSRSAPHRLFDTAGVERALTGSVVQEGDEFKYLDDSAIVPSQSNFSMNALLGQMSVTLDQALPAKVVTVALDEVYLLSTVSGTYTPCPDCGKDSWFNALSAHPFTTDGTGLQGLGHNTERDGFGNYSNSGNYEDTIFGRACWLPPTMLPFSHSAKPTTQAQRLNRLQTQAALYANGYQRDWYGFNKGALIGSFDGVSWFAIGRGRIVRSTSTKLFLAINAPFADLAVPSIHEVNIEAYNGITKASSVDYDPQFHVTDINQNLGGTCQSFHQCSTDTDCVTKLGWEYMCADVKDIKTQWPQFDSNANETANSGAGLTTYDTNGNPTASTATTIDQILAKKGFPSVSTKRCVYRGAGAPCVVNPSTISDLNRKKNLSCAPNFFCANAQSGGLFNGKVARYGASLEEIPLARNHLFGKDANVLGRPLSYLSSADTTSLTSTIVSTLRENIAHNHNLGNTQPGICRPGKSLPETSNQVSLSNPFTQHQFADASRRSDFISQIASCNSTLYTAYRQASCPVIAADGNYEMFATATVATDHYQRARTQNVCGLQSLFNNASLSSNADTMLAFSPFRTIEAKTLPTTTVIEKTLVRDACLRRPGQVCQTDLDCSPNKFHAEQTDVFSLSYFGNQAEKNYYSEYMVCGQTAAEPTYGDTAAYKAYDMSKNRCCREVGKDFTTYTNYIPTATAENNYDSASIGLKMSLDTTTGITLPNDPKRYSRLATVEGLGGATRPLLSSYQDRDNTTGLVAADPQGANVFTPNQWKTLTEANSESCCGGGWVRKFADGSTDWAKTDRVTLDVTELRCLNSRSVLLTRPSELLLPNKAASEYPVADPQLLVDADEGYFCKDGTNTTGACAMYSFLDSLTVSAPVADPFLNVAVSTRVPTFGTANLDHYFSPNSADSNLLTVINYATTGGRRNISLRIPSYIPDTAIAGMLATVAMDPDSGVDISCTGATAPIASLDPLSDGAALGCGAGCCYTYDDAARILQVSASAALQTGAFANRTVGVNFTARAAGYNTPEIDRTRPGSNSFYLKKFGKLELSGIPQVPLEPIYCNDNSNVLVSGIYDIISGVTNKADLEAGTFSTSFSDGANYYLNHKALLNDPVFSPNDFKCCTPLGKTATSATKCCSGVGTATSTTSVICKLPARTDLMVYFNRYVSNEGQGTDQPGGGLLEADFNAQTGEPNLTAAVNLKITELGRAYCTSGKVRQGGAFGRFEPEPQGPQTNVSSRIYNIVDSTRDAGQNSSAGTTVTTGYTPFTQGFRWNHHLYCND